jgi:hypothetical protein
MALLTTKLPKKFEEQLMHLDRDLQRVIVPKVLEAGAPPVLNAIRAKLASVVGVGTKYPSRSYGDLEKALGITTVKPTYEGGHDIKIGFAEPHPGGKANAMLANVLEYGRSKSGYDQPPKPILKPIRPAARAAAYRAMKAQWEEELAKL